MCIQKCLKYDAHVRVRRMNLVHDKQVARKACGAHVRMAHLERSHHRLIDGSDGYLRREKPLCALGRPEALAAAARVRVPPDLVAL